MAPVSFLSVSRCLVGDPYGGKWRPWGQEIGVRKFAVGIGGLLRDLEGGLVARVLWEHPPRQAKTPAMTRSSDPIDPIAGDHG